MDYVGWPGRKDLLMSANEEYPIHEPLKEYIDAGFLGEFLDPDVSISLDEQLRFTSEFWQQCGLAQPSAAEELFLYYSERPGNRIMLAPLLSTAERFMMTHRLQQTWVGITPYYSTLWTIGGDRFYEEAMKRPGREFEELIPGREKERRPGMLYQLDNQELVTLSDYKDALNQDGDLIKTPRHDWVVCAKNIGAAAIQEKVTAKILKRRIRSTDTPEQGLALGALHMINKTSTEDLKVIPVNEHLRVLNKEDEAIPEHSRQAVVYWCKNSEQAGLTPLSIDVERADFYVST